MPKNIRSINPTESQIQCAIVEWANNTKAFGWGKPIGDYLFSIPNGGFRNKLEAINLSRQGVKKGVSDLFLAIPWGYEVKHGLWIECKSNKGKLSISQIEWVEKMKILDYGVAIVKSVDEGIQAIKDYLGMK